MEDGKWNMECLTFQKQNISVQFNDTMSIIFPVHKINGIAGRSK